MISFARIGAGLVLLAALQVDAAQECKSVKGHFVAMPVIEGCTSPVGFCTAGTLLGGLQGSYAFTMLSATPAGAPNPPGVTFYTGTSVVTFKHGGSVTLSDAGAIDLNPFGTGKMAALLTVVSAGSSGYLQLNGSLDLATGQVRGEYVGELCGL